MCETPRYSCFAINWPTGVLYSREEVHFQCQYDYEYALDVNKTAISGPKPVHSGVYLKQCYNPSP